MHRPVSAALAILLTASACVTEPALSVGPDGRLRSLAGTEWQLETLGGVPAAADARIAFESENRAGGNAGCNSFGASYAYDNPAITFGRIEATRMACAGPAMAVEEAFFAALAGARRAGSSATRLVLIGADGTALATFSPRDAG